MTKGYQAENDLTTWLWQEGYATLRAPASGSIDRPSPDVVALKEEPSINMTIGGKIMSIKSFAIELKANSDGTAYFDSHEIEELEEWADRAGAEAYVVIKPDLRSFSSWLVFHTSELNKTDGGYSVTKQMHDKAKTLSEVFA